ncbi:glycine zipper 2TM domain-containing protein [Chitinimonas sp. PSY-7]|uniref:glycine zipper 2TM domain-containing protein n=1 Tax=Chitinimonas sp. PSY-7 TaxID=3459088 RepID=UPI0040402ECA
MNKSMLAGMVIGGAAVVSMGAFAGYQALKGPEYAEVLQVVAVKETIKTPEKVCHDVQVTHKRAVKDENRITGTVIGGLIGGALGNQVGGGNGKKLATVAGAAGGAYAGNQVQKNMQDGDTYITTKQRCTTETKTHEQTVGYDVQYRLDGKTAMIRMDTPPASDRIPVKDGQLQLTSVAVAPKITN